MCLKRLADYCSNELSRHEFCCTSEAFCLPQEVIIQQEIANISTVFIAFFLANSHKKSLHFPNGPMIAGILVRVWGKPLRSGNMLASEAR